MKNNKRKSIIMLCLLLASLIPMSFSPVSADWTIDGDTVYVDDENVYLSATPHTISEDTWVTFELETVSYDGSIDIAWGFALPEIRPRLAQIWENYTHTLWGWHTIDAVGSMTFYNVTEWNNLGIENYSEYDVDIGNENNTLLFRFWYNGGVNESIAAFSSYEEVGDGDDYRITGHYDKTERYSYEETFWDWKPWDANFEQIEYEYGGMNTWWLLRDVDITPGVRYKVRAFVDITMNTNGKYWWAVKPHDKTIAEAVNEGTFYALDPWWNANYDKRVLITIDSSYIEERLVNFPVLVVVNATVLAQCDGGDSIRFVDYVDNTTEFYYEIEAWDYSSNSYVWVNVTDLSPTEDRKFYMYFNNALASDNQHPHETWNSDYFAVWHMNDNTTSTVNDSTINDNTLTKPGANRPSETAGKIGYGQLWDNGGEYMITGDVSTFNFMHIAPSPTFTAEVWQTALRDGNKHFWFDTAADASANAGISVTIRDGDDKLECLIFKASAGNTVLEDSTVAYLGGMNYYALQWDYAINPNGYRLTRNGTSLGTANRDQAPGAVNATNVFHVGARSSDQTKEWRGTMDEFRISSVRRNSSWINASFHSTNQSTDFMTMGSVETASGGTSPMGVINMAPVDNAVNVSILTNLTWENTTIGGISVANFSVYFGTSNPPAFIVNTTNKTYDPTLTFGMTYYWQINLTDNNGDFNLTAVYTFDTQNPFQNLSFCSYSNQSQGFNWSNSTETVYQTINTTIWWLNITTDDNVSNTITVYNSTGAMYTSTGFYQQLHYKITDLAGDYDGEVLSVNYTSATKSFNTTINLTYNVTYLYNITYHNYTIYDGTNYSKELIFNFTYYWGGFENTPTIFSNFTVTNDTDIVAAEASPGNNHTLPGNYTYELILNSSLYSYLDIMPYGTGALNMTGHSSLESTWTADFEAVLDTQAPEYLNTTYNFSYGVNSTGEGTFNITNITDIFGANITINISINGEYFQNTSLTNGSSFEITFNATNGANNLLLTLKDNFNNTYTEWFNMTILVYNFICVDESTGDYIDVTDYVNLNVTSPEIGWSLDLKVHGSGNFTYLSNETYPDTLYPHALRFEIEPTGGVNFTRYFDPSIFPDLNETVRISVPRAEQIYEQKVQSTIEREFGVFCLDSDAWIMLDHTRFVGGVEGSNFVQYVYTIDALYYFRVYENGVPILLSTLDGGKAVTIDLELLIGARGVIPSFPGSLYIQKPYNHTLMIYFINTLSNDSNVTSIEITNVTGHHFLWYNETANPNEFYIYFDWQTVTPQPNESEPLTITATTSDGNNFSLALILNKMPGPVFGSPADFPAIVAFFIVIGLLIFGLTLFSTSTTFAFFGPVVCAIGLFVTTLTEQLWFITLLQLVLIVFIIYQLILFRYEHSTKGYNTMSGGLR